MRFTDFLPEDCIHVGLEVRDGSSVLHELADLLAARTKAPSGQLEQRLVDRERVSSTAIGQGVAIPHCRVERLRSITVGMVIDPEGVDFGARDGAPVRLFVAIVSPADAPGTHLRLIARIAALLRDARLRQELVGAPAAAAARALLVQAEDAYLLTQQGRHDIHMPTGGP
ncbi:MAG: PTS sugar transporter subunit IIA [Archangium sp.]